ncbi:hypothetical protein D3C79_890080 [compost metagenome]
MQRQDGTRIACQPRTCWRQADRAGGALQQFLPGFALEPPNVRADRRLRQVQPFGSTGKTTAVGNGKQATQKDSIEHGLITYLTQ